MNFLQKIYNPDLKKSVWIETHDHGESYTKNSNENSEMSGYPSGHHIFDNLQDLDSYQRYIKEEPHDTFKERIKKVLSALKEMAVKNEEEHTICLIIEENFHNAIFSIINNCEFLMNSRIN